MSDEQTKQKSDQQMAHEPATMKTRHLTTAEKAVSAAQSLMAETAILGAGGFLKESITPAIDAMSCLERAANYLRMHCLQVRNFDQLSKDSRNA